MKAVRFLVQQRDGDCEEMAADMVIGAIKGHRLKETTIDMYARNAGILLRDGTHYGFGSNWFGPNGITKLMAHYGIRSTTAARSIKTIEADLAAGDRVIAFVNADTLWNASAVVQTRYGHQGGPADLLAADHAVVLDQINTTASVATVSDSGAGLTYTVPLKAWRAAVATSGNQYNISHA